MKGGNTTVNDDLLVSLISPFTLGGKPTFEIIDVGGVLSSTFIGLAEGASLDFFA